MNTQRGTQIGLIFAVLGVVVTFIGFFPGAMGLGTGAGVGFFQVTVVLIGSSILLIGAYIFVQAMYYPGAQHTFAQQVAIRLSMTGMILSTASGLADVLGIGSNPLIGDQRGFLGAFQFIGLFGGFFIASLGVLIFAIFGDPNSDANDSASNE